ncbi:hypothetical protein amrb99_13010 [Actinomadura sp. RB99]|uniref:hypothetical protein n=1 Tax=Actinomadura sp. RB99 TaxID=2691577 RepID=UPI0016894C07|nr:hypothetical protein [Actinomadura sp. RB99]MBD2892391.1 hypothetical protein [Actinomadura sp. RB99]
MYSMDISRVIIADRVRERQAEARNVRRARLVKALKRCPLRRALTCQRPRHTTGAFSFCGIGV